VVSEVIDRVEVTVPPPGLGRVPGRVRGPLFVIESYWVWYKKNWRATAVSTVVQPALFLVALGLGFGSQVQPGAATGGLRYVEYLAPALLAATAMQIGAFESSYPILSGFKWQGQFLAMAAAPLTPAQIAIGTLSWNAIRMVSSGVVYLVIAAVLGALTGPAVLLALPVAVLTGMAVSAPFAAYSATLENEAPFSGVFRFIVLPMTLFAGTFFPVDSLPVWVRPLAWVTPLWHGTEVARGVSFGWLSFWPAVGHLAYLLVLAVGGTWLTARHFRVRLAK
jgi:lipooligosaccharide transport system permease protein